MRVFFHEEQIPLGDLEPGHLFTDEERSYVALKSEYMRDGQPECYLLGSGEAFWGPAEKRGEPLYSLLVIPMVIV